MNDFYWKVIFMVLWVTFSLIRLPHGSRYKKTKKTCSKKALREKFLVFLAAFGMLIIPLIYVFSPWLNAFNMKLSNPIRLISAGCLMFSLVLFWKVHLDLGKNWSPILEIREGHNLVSSGIYQYIRHPMYTQIWIWVIGQGLVLANWFVVIVGILTWSILFFIRVPDEEKLMISEFGDEYLRYMRRTKKIIPYIY